jgi:uncharacterized protein
MKRLRIVIDTNVLISAAVRPQGRQAPVINLVAFFSRPKFARLPSAEVAALLALIESEATMVTPTTRLEISKHDSDNRFYECADAAQADYIVTGNARHFTKPYKNTRTVNGRELLELMAARQEEK